MKRMLIKLYYGIFGRFIYRLHRKCSFKLKRLAFECTSAETGLMHREAYIQEKGLKIDYNHWLTRQLEINAF